MQHFEEPQLSLEWITSRMSPWMRWENRGSLPDLDKPGVYILANLRSPHDGHALSDKVAYIGETTLWLGRRLSDFHRSAFQSKNGHSGGWTYQEKGGKQHGLFVSCLPIFIEGEKMRAYVRAAERLLLWEYVQKNGEFPWANSE